MRVLEVHNRYRTPGGEERHVEMLVHDLALAGVEVDRFDVATPSHLSLSSRLRLGFTLAYRPSGAQLLRSVLTQTRPDVVHFHNIFPLLTPAAIREARRHGAVVVLTIHNYRFACPSGTLLRNGHVHEDCIEGSSLLCGLRNARGIWSESIAYGLALEIQRRLQFFQRWVDAYIVPSRFMANMLARAGYPEDRIHTVSHGVSIDDSPSIGGSYALYAGRLSAEKGTQTLVAASQLTSSGPLIVAGSGPLTPLVEANDGAGLSYRGHVSQAEVAELMRGALFTLMPSECYEGQPYAALESMAVGTPIVASRLGGLAEIIVDGLTGVLLPAGDPAALAAAMGSMWADRDRAAQMGSKAWNYARNQFNRQAQVDRLISLYELLLSQGR